MRGIRFTVSIRATAAVVDRHDRAARRSASPISAGTCRSTWAATRSSRTPTLLQRLPTPIVFDHIGRLPLPGPLEPSRPTASSARLLDKGRTWVKLSGAYMNTKVGPPTYAESDEVAQAYIKAAPERLVWGSDWPHPTEKRQAGRRDAVRSADRMGAGRGDAPPHPGDNPEALYGFAKTRPREVEAGNDNDEDRSCRPPSQRVYHPAPRMRAALA